MVKFAFEQAEKRAVMFASTLKALRSLEGLINEVKKTHDTLETAIKALDFAQVVILEQNEKIKTLSEQLERYRP